MTAIDSINDQNICAELLKLHLHINDFFDAYIKEKTLNCLIFTVMLEAFPKFGG